MFPSYIAQPVVSEGSEMKGALSSARLVSSFGSTVRAYPTTGVTGLHTMCAYNNGLVMSRGCRVASKYAKLNHIENKALRLIMKALNSTST